MGFYLHPDSRQSHSASCIANKKKRKEEYMSIIIKDVKGQNGPNIDLCSIYTERMMSVQLWEKIYHKDLMNEHKTKYYI